MTCRKCGSENVTVQVINQVRMKTKHHSIIWWLFVGCWWVPIKWLFFTLPALIIKIFVPKRQKVKNITVSKCVCQNCGYTWNA